LILTDATARNLLGWAGLRDPAFLLRSLDAQAPIEVEVDADRALYPASMIKTPLAAAVLAAAAAGELDLSATALVEGRNMTANDLPSPLVPGYRAGVAELVDFMITQSDNVATNVLIDVIGRGRATALLRELGFPATAIRRKLSGSDPLIDDPEATGRNTHPAREAAALFEALAQDAFPFARSLRGPLERQRWNTKLSAGLEPGDRFAHKTGDTSEVSHDGGILTTAGGRRFVVVLYTGMPSSDDVDARFATFMRGLRPYLA
jgi:beta-lactamase class A